MASNPAAIIRQPDLTIWFDLPADVAAARLADARSPDRFEALDTAFFHRVAQGYAARAASAPQRFARIDAAQPQAQVWQQLTAVLVQRGWLAAPGEGALGRAGVAGTPAGAGDAGAVVADAGAASVTPQPGRAP